MQAIASAPGKLVWLGEYAVLDGVPALVMAVNRRARVRLSDTAAAVDKDARGAWSRDPAALAIVAALTDFGIVARPPACAPRVDTSELFVASDGARVKLGLGSSAAMTVALVGAACGLGGVSMPGLDALVRVHRRGQGGRGSGVDVAAARNGGFSLYRIDGDVPESRPARLPAGLRWCCLWSGRPASTGELLRRIEAWREREPVRYQAALAGLSAVASAGAAAVDGNDAGALVRAVGDYGEQLARLGEASAVDIVCDEHRAIGALAAACGAAYKPCGAGGGDAGIAVATDDGAIANLCRRATDAGWRLLDVALDERGLDVRLAH